MAEVEQTVELRAAAPEVWKLVGNFSGLAEWHPLVTATTVEERGGDPVRTVTITGGEKLIDRLVERDNAAMTYETELIEGPVPVESMRTRLSVVSRGEFCAVSLRATFEPKRGEKAKAEEIISSIQASGLQALKKKFG